MTKTEHHLMICAPAMAGLAGQVARALAQGRDRLAEAGYGAAAIGPSASAQIHIDETLIGRVPQGLAGFFPQVGGRARDYAGRLGGPVGRLVITTLPYDLYYPMMWRFLAQRRAVQPFAEMAELLVARERGWVELVSELSAALGARETVILPAPVRGEEALAALVPGASLPMPPAAAQENVPDTGLVMLQRLYRTGATIAPRQIQRLMQFHARQPQPAPLAAFSALEAARLRRRYQADLATLAARPGVRIGAAPELVLAAE